MVAALHQRLLAALPPAHAPAFADATLEPALVEALASVQATLDFPVDAALFVAALAPALDSPAELATLALTDLVLARACAEHHPGALRTFDRTLGPELDRALARSPNLGLSKAEFRQLALIRLVIHDPPHAAKITSYRGRGSLRAWLRVMVARWIIDLARKPAAPSQPGEPALLDALTDRQGPDPELDWLRQHYDAPLRDALATAIAGLAVRQRNLLRQRYFHQLSVDALARIHGVHRSTLYVWLEQARVSLLQRVRDELASKLPAERLESVIRMMGSQLELSMQRVLSHELELEA